MTNRTNTSEQPKSNRRKLYQIHTWVGFHLAFLMMVVLATGTFATVSNEIDWLIQKEMRVTPGDKKVSWQTMTDAINNYAPDVAINNIQHLHGDYLAYRALVKNTAERSYYIYVNQWNGAVTGETSRITVQRVLRDLHRHLFFPKQIGLWFVSSMAFILLISLYTGLKTSRNWKTLMTRVRTHKGTRVMIGDAHKATGLWSVWLIVVMAVTGIWYLAELGSEIAAFVKKDPTLTFITQPSGLSEQRLKELGDTIETPLVSDIVKATEKALPEIKGSITNIRFPSTVGRPIEVLGVRDNPLLRERANRVFLDPENLDIIEVQRSENISWVSWVNEIADPLHFGFFGGIITKLIWFIFGLAMTSLSITGVYLTWRRLKSKETSRPQMLTLPILILGLVYGYLFWYPSYLPPKQATNQKTINHKINDTLSLSANLSLNKENQANGRIRLSISNAKDIPNIKEVYAQASKKNELIGKLQKAKATLLHTTSIFKASLAEQSLIDADTLVITIALHTGQIMTANVPIKEKSS